MAAQPRDFSIAPAAAGPIHRPLRRLIFGCVMSYQLVVIRYLE